MATYRIKAPDGATYRVTAPDDATQEQVFAMVQQQLGAAPAARGPDLSSPEFKAKVATQQAADRAEYDPLKDMNWGQRIAASAGAGFTDLFKGAQQRYTEAFGSDEDKRRVQQEVDEARARDEHLVQNTAGGGIARAVGEAAPMVLIPGGTALKAKAALGAATGALSGYLQPTSGDESALKNAAIGGALGGVFPLALAGAGKVAGKVLEPVKAAWGTRNSATQARAARDLVQAVAPEGATAKQAASAALNLADELEASARAAGGHAGPGGIPLSAAATTQNAKLAQLERVARMKDPGAWRELDEATARAMTGKLKEATAEAAEKQARITARSDAYDVAKKATLEKINPEDFARLRQGLREGIELAKRSPAAEDDSVRAVLEKLGKRMDDLGDDYSAEHLMEVRKKLSSTVNAKFGETDPYKLAPRDARPIKDIKGNIDAVLDAASDGTWSTANKAYREMSPGVKQAQAAGAVKDVFFDPETGAARRFAEDVAGDLPRITEGGLNRAKEVARDKLTGKSLLSENAQAALGQTMEAVRKKNIIQTMNRAATGGGNSATGANLVALAQDEIEKQALQSLAQTGLLGKAGAAAYRGIKDYGEAKTRAATNIALQDTATLARMLREGAAKAGRELPPGRAVELAKEVSRVLAGYGQRAPGVMAAQGATRGSEYSQ